MSQKLILDLALVAARAVAESDRETAEDAALCAEERAVEAVREANHPRKLEAYRHFGIWAQTLLLGDSAMVQRREASAALLAIAAQVP